MAPTESRSQPLLLDTQLLVLSVVSLWEVAIKSSLGRADFQVEAAVLRLGLLGQGFRELPVRAEHVLALQHLPWIHRDPHRCAEDFVYDRLLVVQAQLEGLELLSADRALGACREHVQAAG